MAEVRLIRKQAVISTKPVQPGKFHHLSVLDRVMERNHLLMVLYYHPRTGIKAGDSVDKLSDSLSETLSAFPVAIGRLLRTPEGHWTVKCNDAGLRMVVAKAKGTVEEWLRNVDREKELKLILWEDMYYKPYFWSTFYVQITEFEGGGVAIGLSCAHIICDPICMTKLINAWADMNLGGKMMSPPFFHPLPQRRPGVTNGDHQPSVQLINHYESALENPGLVSNAKQTTVTFLFNQEKVTSCIAKAGTLYAHDQVLTPFEALAALFWICISKIKGIKGSLVDMSICLHTRKLLGLDKGYFGNCMVYNRVDGYRVHGDDAFSRAAFSINRVVQETDYDSIVDLIEWLEEQGKCENPPWMNGNHLICANFEDVEINSAVFEDNASPLRVSYYIELAVGPGQVLILSPPRGEGAMSQVVMVTLPEYEAEKLVDDDFVKQFAPTILMGLNKKHC